MRAKRTSRCMVPAPTISELIANGVSRGYAYELLRGDKVPSLALAVSLEKSLGVPPRWWTERLAA